jgi:hypothetical protein
MMSDRRRIDQPPASSDGRQANAGHGSGHPPSIDPTRHRRVRRFFIRMVVQMILFDVIFSLPLLRWLKPPDLPRWQRLARRYKQTAVEMGGVLIKLGHFVSTRVDLLPPAVIHEKEQYAHLDKNSGGDACGSGEHDCRSLGIWTGLAPAEFASSLTEHHDDSGACAAPASWHKIGDSVGLVWTTTHARNHA